jgi:hypothetical protein
MSTNPLINYLRKPEIYVKLPSGGKWWPEGSIAIPPNGELPIMAMNGHDDIVMRNADGLMNGASSVGVIESCVPNIKDAWAGPNIDIEYLYIAIRIASYGSELEVDRKCSKCKEETKLGINLQIILERLNIPDFETPIQVGDLFVMLKPASFHLTNITAQEIFEQQKAILTARSSDITMEQKEKILKNSIMKLSSITVSKLIEHIDYIILPNGNRVSEQEFLQEFIDQIDRKNFNILKKGIDEKNRQYGSPDLPFTCSNEACNHEESFKFEFNPSNFFGADS